MVKNKECVNVEEVGRGVIPLFVSAIAKISASENAAGTCDKVQTITHGYGAAEVLITLSEFPTNSSDYISNVINLAPCAIQVPERIRASHGWTHIEFARRVFPGVVAAA